MFKFNTKHITSLFFSLIFLGAAFTIKSGTAPLFLYDTNVKLYDKSKLISDESKAKVPKDIVYYNLKGSVYNALAAQTDSTPLLTASMIEIDTIKLKSGKIRYVALSRDLINVYNKGGRIRYGDYIIVESKYKELNGRWRVVDCLNPRYSNKVDFLFYDRKYGTYKNIKIKKEDKV